MKTFFVTGTDTGVGKTFVACGLARRACELGLRVFGFKPIETGCERICGRLVGADQELLAAAAGDWQRDALRGVYRFVLPAAPLVAAEAEGQTIDLQNILKIGAEGSRGCDLTIVEGAGGWRVPITSTTDMGGLAKMLGEPVVVVGRATLGTINHTLLTIEAVLNDDLEIAAVVISKRPEDSESVCRSNIEQIQRMWRGCIVTAAQLDVLLT